MRILLIHPGAPFSTSDVYDGYLAGLRALGVDVEECRLDRYLQFVGLTVAHAGLAAANGIALAGAFVAQQALIAWPDLVVAVGATNLHRGTAAALTRAGLRTVAVLLDSPYLLDIEAKLASAYAHVTTNERTAVPALIDAVGHGRVTYLPTAYHPAAHTPAVDPWGTPFDVAFIGSLFAERRALFDGAGLDDLRRCVGGFDPSAETRGYIDNATAARVARASRVNVNPHRTTMWHGDGRACVGAESLGPRAYELAALGAFQLMSDDRPEAREVFGASLATYRAGDADDLGRQVRRWLADDARREAMAAGQRIAVVGRHSYTERARSLLEWVA